VSGEFTWADLARIGRTVFSRLPENEQELLDYFRTLLLFSSHSYGIVRGSAPILSANDNLRRAAWDAVRTSYERLTLTAQLFGRERAIDMIELILSELIGSLRRGSAPGGVD
jgi:gamma-glutamyl:cysteine ligase YbdK (ATP-grasp superfamily)